MWTFLGSSRGELWFKNDCDKGVKDFFKQK